MSLGGFFLPVMGPGMGYQAVEEVSGNDRHFVDSLVEGRFVGL
jgi:hypothetical protein